MIFDGRAFAKEIEEQVKTEVAKLSRKPVIMSILVGSDPASELYTSLKKKAAERVGIQFGIHRVDMGFKIDDLRGEISKIAESEEVDGIMIQLPIPGLSREDQNEIVKLIPLDKDVDGLRWEESGVMPATVRAIILIMDRIEKITNYKFSNSQILVVGGTGAVGRPLVYYLKSKFGIEAEIANSKTQNLGDVVSKNQVIISSVGRAGLIKEDMVSSNMITIDVGINKVEGKIAGDMESEIYQKASLAVPVPGGVGPVTVASLMKNALDMVHNQTIGKLRESDLSE